MIENIESRLWEVFENPEERERAITSLKNAKRVNNLKNDTVLMLLWYAKAVDGTLIRKNPELLRDNYAMSTWHHYCSGAYKLIYHRNKQGMCVGLRPKYPKKWLTSEFKRWFKQIQHNNIHGERSNCPSYLSEMIPCLRDENYYHCVSKKVFSLSNFGDGFTVSSGMSSEVEVKFTTSGGVRQTFSKGQINKPTFTVISLDGLHETLRELHLNNDAKVNLTIYDCGCSSFKDLLIENKNRKDAMKGTGRYEISNMIAEIEKRSAYNKKELFVLNIGD
tara:strand:+ start:789 stop:1619 length:831 start_codon:yes stop_codon:yes gene_type:complete